MSGQPGSGDCDSGKSKDGTSRLVPDPKDEPEVQWKLYGRNEAEDVVLDGWTGCIVKRFIEPKQNLAVKSIPYSELPGKFQHFRWDEGLKRFVRKADDTHCKQIADLYPKSGQTSFKLSDPLVVQVIEKKSIYVSIKKGTEVLLLGIIIIADDTGYCFLTGFNDNIAAVYNVLKIGHHIIISKATIKKFDLDDKNFVTLRNDKAVSMEIKLNTFDAREVYAIEPPGMPKILPELFPEKTTWIPADLFDGSAAVYSFPENTNAINICGVVSYVGQMYRKKNLNSDYVYSCFRWIQIVDCTVSKPLTVLLRVTNVNSQNQDDVVPGTAVVITNVVSMPEEENYCEFFVQTTFYSRVFINSVIVTEYLQPLPKPNRVVAKKILSPNNCDTIFARKDVIWSVGGTLLMKILDTSKFLNNFQPERILPGPRKLVRRELERIFVKAFVQNIFIIWRGSKTQLLRKLYWSQKRELNVDKNNVKEKIQTGLPDLNKQWFPFIKKLQSPNTSLKGKLFEKYENNQKCNKEICSPLLLPAKYSKAYFDLPVVGDDSWFEFQIFDPQREIQYTCIWKSGPMEEMKARLKIYIDENRLNKPSKEKSENDGSAQSYVSVNGDNHPSTSKSAAENFNKTDSVDSVASTSNPIKDNCNAFFLLEHHKIEDSPGNYSVINVVDFVIN